MKKRRPVLADQGRRFLTNSVGVDWLISISRKIFFTIVTASFFHKRKMLKNNLKGWKNLFHKKNGKIELAGIDLSRRGETLSLEDFAILANHIHTCNG